MSSVCSNGFYDYAQKIKDEYEKTKAHPAFQLLYEKTKGNIENTALVSKIAFAYAKSNVDCELGNRIIRHLANSDESFVPQVPPVRLSAKL